MKSSIDTTYCIPVCNTEPGTVCLIHVYCSQGNLSDSSLMQSNIFYFDLFFFLPSNMPFTQMHAFCKCLQLLCSSQNLFSIKELIFSCSFPHWSQNPGGKIRNDCCRKGRGVTNGRLQACMLCFTNCRKFKRRKSTSDFSQS